MGLPRRKLTGLTANDRTVEEKKEIEQIKNSVDTIQQYDSLNLSQYPNYEIKTDTAFNTPISQMSTEQYLKRLSDIATDAVTKDKAYNENVDSLMGAMHGGMDVSSKYTEEIKKIAETVSPYYRKFRNTDNLTLTTGDWNGLAAQYAAAYDIYGEEFANQQLDQSIKDNVAKNQPVLEKAWYALAGMGADAAGSMISGAGMIYGLANAITGNYEKNPYLSDFDNFMSQIVDNDVTRYGSDIVKYGTILKLNEAKELGIPATEIVNTEAQNQQLLSINTPFELIQQGGFTVASMFTAAAASKISNLLFTGLKKGALGIANIGNTSSNIVKGKNLISFIRRGENFNNRVLVPGIVGSVEGVVEGLETKRNIEEQSYDEAYAMQRQAVEKAVMDKLQNYTEFRESAESYPEYYDKNGNKVDIDKLYNDTWEEMKPKLDQSLAHVDAMASRAGNANFLVNSVINGFINATYKAGLQSERVQDALRKGKLTGWAFSNEKMNISGGFGNAKVTPKITQLDKAWMYAKEPIGEFKEEYLQTLSDSYFTGFAENSIHSFIDNKYNGDARKAIGEATSDDWAAAWTELSRSLVSKESMKSGIYGALSSILGTPAFGRSTNKLDKNGKVVFKRDRQGNIKTTIDSRGRVVPVTEKTYFGRGQSADGDRETVWEAFRRMAPWRSGLTANIYDVNQRLDAAKEQAQALENWLNDPKNKDKFNGVAGALTWMRDMGSSASLGNEFNYRNSRLGKTINDLFMLQKLEGTDLYESIMDQLVEVANMEEGSDLAQRYIQSIKDNVNTQDTDMSDEDIFDMLKKNANNLLNMRSKVQEESIKLEKLLGDMDDDTKQSLIYAQLAIEDWKRRKEQLDNELAEIKIENSADPSHDVSDKQRALIAEYGSLEGARKAREELLKTRNEIRTNISSIKNRGKNITSQEKSKLKILNAYMNSIMQQLKKFDVLEDLSEDADFVMNEQEIMSLDPISRAKLLLKGKKQLYKKLYQSTSEEGEQNEEEQLNGIQVAQKKIIDNLVNQGIAINKDFLAKVIDVGRIQSAINLYLRQYNAILMSPNGLKSYADRVKQQAADELTKEKAGEIAKIQDYTEFVAALNNAFDSGTDHDVTVLEGALKDNENYRKYVEQGKALERLMKTVAENSKFKDMDANSVDLLAQSIYYMYSQGVDLNDENAVFSALNETDERGYNKFVSFVDAQNQGLDISQQTRFTSIEEVFQTYKDVLLQARYDSAQQERLSKPIEIKAETPQSSPTPPPTPTPQSSNDVEESTQPQAGQKQQLGGIFAEGLGFSSPDEGHVKEEDIDRGTTKEFTPTSPLNQAKQGERKDTVESTIKEPEEQPTNFVAKVRNIIKGNAKVKNYENGAKIAGQIMDSLTQEDLESYESLNAAIERETKKLLANNDNDDAQVAAYLLKQAVAAVNPTSALKGGTSERQVNTNSAQISTMDIDYARKMNGNSASVRFYDRYNIELYLSQGTLSRDKDIFFVTDEELAREVQEEMSSYDEKKDLPIVAVVEDENGEYIVDGKKYQPIGIMPSTGNPYRNGSDRMADVRKLAEVSGRKLIMYKGKPLKTKPHGATGVKARPVDNNTREERNTVDLIMDLEKNTEERSRMQSQDIRTRRTNPVYKRLKEAFMKMLDVVTAKNPNTVGEHKMIAYMQPNMKDGRGQTIYLIPKSIEETINPDSGKTLLQTINENTDPEIVDFNSRTRGIARAVKSFLSKIPNKFESNTLDSIIKDAKSLQEAFGHYLFFVNKGNWHYVISPADEEVSRQNGEPTLILEVENEDGEKIFLTTFSKNMDINEVTANIIKNLTTDNGDWRMVDDSLIVHWQVDYGDINAMHNGNQMASNNISDLIDDNIFKSSASSLQYEGIHVDIESPFVKEDVPRFSHETNKDNASEVSPIGEPVLDANQVTTSNGITVEPESGTILKGTAETMEKPTNSIIEQKVKQIVEDSKKLELTTDEKAYVNTVTRRIYNRVTRIISTDENGSHFNEESGYVLPSTSIGNSTDVFVRDFFDGDLKDFESYPNATKEDWKVFENDLKKLKDILDSKGIKIIAKDVKVFGTVQVQDHTGATHEIDVAGTLDLLGYDDAGNFYIFDMKTIHNPAELQKNKVKWELQTSLYQKFLEQTYGITVVDRFIIPIHVHYEKPDKVTYTPGDNNQLIVNGREFREAKPRLLHGGLFKVDYRELNIDFDKMTEEEKESLLEGTPEPDTETNVVKEVIDLAKNGGTTDGSSMEGNPVNTVVTETQEPVLDPTLGVFINNDVFDGFFGDSLPNVPIENPGTVNTIVEGKIPWSKLTPEQKAKLPKGLTEESYNKIETQEEIDQINQCLGLK